MSQSKAPLSKLIYEHPQKRVKIEAVVLDDDSCPAEEFLDRLSDIDVAKMKALFNLFAGRHPLHLSGEKFKKIEGTDLFEFKNFQIRVPCFFVAGSRVLLTHGLIKKADRLPKSEIKRAREIRAVFEKRGSSHA